MDVAHCLASLNGSGKVYQLITNAFSIQLVEITLIFGGIFISYLKVICLPPRCGYIDVTLRSGNHKLTFRFYAVSNLYGCYSVWKKEVYLRKFSVFFIFFRETGNNSAICIFNAQKLKNRQKRSGPPFADAVPVGSFGSVMHLKAGTGGA